MPVAVVCCSPYNSAASSCCLLFSLFLCCNLVRKKKLHKNVWPRLAQHQCEVSHQWTNQEYKHINNTILQDPRAVSRAGMKGATNVSQHGRRSLFWNYQMSNAEHIALLQKRLWRMLYIIILNGLHCTILMWHVRVKIIRPPLIL